MQHTTLRKNRPSRFPTLPRLCMTFGEPDCENLPWTLPEESSRPSNERALEGGINLIPPIAIPMVAAKRSSVAHCGISPVVKT